MSELSNYFLDTRIVAAITAAIRVEIVGMISTGLIFLLLSEVSRYLHNCRQIVESDERNAS
jgi:hypothetical protein